MQSVTRPSPRGRVETMLDQMAGPWWMFLVTGIGWLVISLIVLRFRLASVAAVGVLMGVVFLGAGSANSLSPRSDRGGAGRTC